MQKSPQSKSKSTYKMPFVKMHGLGNDFVMLHKSDFDNYLKSLINQPESQFKQVIITILNRRIGIGADQLIIYEIIDDYNVRMEIYNPDGSKANACGNASRCMVKLLSDNYKMDEFILHAGNRELLCAAKDGEYAVNMGEVKFEAEWMPSSSALRNMAAQYNMQPKDLICGDIGNPHLMIFSKLSDKDKEIIGQNMQNSELFPDGVNVNFVEINRDEINLKVYERGTGFTLACGSGACASFSSAHRLGYVSNQAKVRFQLGKLSMELNQSNQVIMQGPAEYSFMGEFDYG